MGLFDFLNKKPASPEHRNGLVPYGNQKKDDSHDHRYNTGNDRTPAQKEGDKKRSGK